MYFAMGKKMRKRGGRRGEGGAKASVMPMRKKRLDTTTTYSPRASRTSPLRPLAARRPAGTRSTPSARGQRWRAIPGAPAPREAPPFRPEITVLNGLNQSMNMRTAGVVVPDRYSVKHDMWNKKQKAQKE